MVDTDFLPAAAGGFLAGSGIPLPHHLLCRFAISKSRIASPLQTIQLDRPVPPGKTDKPWLIPESFYRGLVVSALLVSIVEQVRLSTAPRSRAAVPYAAYSNFDEKDWTFELLA
jgi:hypothetical protein